MGAGYGGGLRQAAPPQVEEYDVLETTTREAMVRVINGMRGSGWKLVGPVQVVVFDSRMYIATVVRPLPMPTP